MRPNLPSIISVFFLACTALVAQQLELDRISQMPDMPSSYDMRDWKEVAWQYDSLVFDVSREGEHFPIVSLGTAGVNYPDIQPIFMDSYVGSTAHGHQREAINIIPAVVGASLVGINKSAQYGQNWVTKIKDFYNLKNNELVYLNGPTDRSGHDWWYETMPNVFFYQLYDLYPGEAFDEHFISVADRWLQAVEAMGGNDAPWSVPFMNYRAWSLTEMAPLESGVKEPEAAGAIAWILYQAYTQTSDEKYLIGAQWATDFLNAQNSNPSYELQLPYGVLAAAKLNAHHEANYDIEKMLNWCFDRGDLRGWGSVVGTWGGQDVSGLIGEANDQGNDYVFVMNGFQQAAALAPVVKYDKRFAKSIAKWILNVANASRLFYSEYLPENQQSDYSWSQTYDPNSVIAYEAIKENWDGTALYARGDSKGAGWAETNLSLYGSSHVGYLGALIEQTEIDGILRIDLNITDFFAANDFPTYLYYNPHDADKSVTLDVGGSFKDIYEAISESKIGNGVSGPQKLTIPAKGVLLLSLLPADTELTDKNGKLLAGESVVDFHYGYDFSPQLRVKSLAAENDQIELDTEANIYATVDGAEKVAYQWYIDGEPAASSSQVLTFTPKKTGPVTIKVVASADAQSTSDSLTLDVVELIPEPPVIHSISAGNKWVRPGDAFTVEADVEDPKGLDLTYEWSVENGAIVQVNDTTVEVVASEGPGVMVVSLTASNYSEATTSTRSVLVVAEQEPSEPMVQLSFNKTAEDQSSYNFNTSLSGGTFVPGPVEDAYEALQLSSTAHQLVVSNDDQLNFSEQIGISLWVSFTNFSEERFIISHGSWEQRWKLSTTFDKRLRWTVNTTKGIKDLDSDVELQSDRWYYVTAVYDGHSMQLYLDGELNTFLAHSGEINPSDVGISVGKRLPGDDRYDLRGTVDEVRIYDTSPGPVRVSSLMNEWSSKMITGLADQHFTMFPNPASTYVKMSVLGHQAIRVMHLSGQTLKHIINSENSGDVITLDVSGLPDGIYLIRSSSGVVRKLIIQK